VFPPVKRVLTALAAVLAMAVLASGCGSNTGVASPSDVDLSNGQKKFQVTCGGCHTLAAAGSKGTIGPNLDAAYQQPADEGFDRTSFEALVRQQIELGATNSQPPMPAELLTGQDAQDVAAYVAAAACNPCPKELQTGS
jgi:mono/diheme cytochrome c family protein